MRAMLRAAGIVAILVGCVWAAQGAGIFPYPRESFMINQTPWIWYGAILALVGVVAVAMSRRM